LPEWDILILDGQLSLHIVCTGGTYFQCLVSKFIIIIIIIIIKDIFNSIHNYRYLLFADDLRYIVL
jgi:hypothetical protein